MVVRTEEELPSGIKDKLALFCDVKPNAVIESRDVETLYTIPLNLQAQGMDDLVLDHFGIQRPEADMNDWRALENKVLNLKGKVTVGLVGKYVSLPDAYLSIVEALKHAGYAHDTEIDIRWIDAEEVDDQNVADYLADVDGVLVPGGFGSRGLIGKIAAIRYAREHKLPFFGICLGMQLACIEFARNVVGIHDADTGEENPACPHKIIDLLPDQEAEGDLGGTLRLGLYPCRLVEGTLAHQLYGQEVVQERHRHRYEFNNAYRERLAAAGLTFSGLSPDGRLVEIVEIKDHPFFIAAQFHPEFISRPNRPQAIFDGFVAACQAYQA